jgi:hypothetical protein
MKKSARRGTSGNDNIRIAAVIIFGIVVLLIAWNIISPGIFIVQPNSAYPHGKTIIYHSRGQDISFVSSPEDVCLKVQGTASAACQELVISELDTILNRAIISFP